jgi:hypothetical protein
MPSIVTAAQLRAVLGVSSSLYNDAYLNEIVNTSEAVILPMLVANTTAIDSYKLTTNVAYYYTLREHHFVAGQSVIIAGLPSPFSGTFTIATAGAFQFTVLITNADVERRESIPSGTATLSGYSAADIYAGNDAVESAILAVSVEVFQSRIAAGGQIEGVDFASTPYRMGRSLTNRVSTLLYPYLDAQGFVQ